MDIIKSYLDAAKDRIKSPLAFCFVGSWIVYNWKVWYVTTFMTTKELGMSKLKYIEEYFLSDSVSYFWKPFVLGLLVVILYPIMSFLTGVYREYVRNTHKYWVLKVKEERSYSIEDVDKAVFEVKEELNIYKSENIAYRNTINTLRNDIKELRGLIENEESNDLNSDSLNKLAKKVADSINESKGEEYLYFNRLLKNLKGQSIEVKNNFIMAIYSENDFVEVDGSELRLTKKGADFNRLVRSYI